MNGTAPLGLKSTLAWAAAAAVIAAGFLVSYFLQRCSPNASSRPEEQDAMHSLPEGGATLAPQSEPTPTPTGDGWVLLAADDAHVQVSFPGVAHRTTETTANPTGRPPITSIQYQVDLDESSFALLYVRFLDSHLDPSATVERIVESTRDGMLRKTGARLLSQRWFEYQGWPALDMHAELLAEGRHFGMDCRIILEGRRHYSLMAINGSQEDVHRFFESLRLALPDDSLRLPHRKNWRSSNRLEGRTP